MSAALNANEDRGGAEWRVGAWSCANVYTGWISKEMGSVRLSSLPTE